MLQAVLVDRLSKGQAAERLGISLYLFNNRLQQVLELLTQKGIAEGQEGIAATQEGVADTQEEIADTQERPARPRGYRHTPRESDNPRYKWLPLTDGHDTLVRRQLFDWLNQWKWHVVLKRNTYYARRNRKKTDGPGSHWIMLHNAIWEKVIGPIPIGSTVDHKNGNGLDNRLDNLRLATPEQQALNRSLASNNTSGYIGVSWSKSCRKWHASVMLAGDRIYSKYFHDPYSAAWSRNHFCRLHCPRAKLNSLPERRTQQLPFAIEQRAKPHLYGAA